MAQNDLLTPSVVGFATATRRIMLRSCAPAREDFLLVPGINKSNLTVTAGKGIARIATRTVVFGMKIELFNPLRK